MIEQKCISCIRDSKTGICYDIKDKKARELMSALTNEITGLKNYLNDLEQAIKNSGSVTINYTHNVVFEGSDFRYEFEFVSDSSEPITTLSDLSYPNPKIGTKEFSKLLITSAQNGIFNAKEYAPCKAEVGISFKEPPILDITVYDILEDGSYETSGYGAASETIVNDSYTITDTVTRNINND